MENPKLMLNCVHHWIRSVALERVVFLETGEHHQFLTEDLADLCLEYLFKQPGAGPVMSEVAQKTGCDPEWLFNAFYKD